jgi:hypothetical protein
VLRQAILCRADVSLFTLEWSRDLRLPRADFGHEHTCVDWRRIFEWAGKRRVEREVFNRLQHPLHGTAFVGGNVSWLGATNDQSPTVT